MARRTTRHKIKYHAGKLNDHLDRYIADLETIFNLAEGQSAIVNSLAPVLAAAAENLKTATDRFDAQL